jgi:hypothetical protein
MNRTILAVILSCMFLVPRGDARAEESPVFTPEYLAEVMRYLYRWHLDETALLTIDDSPQIEFRFRQRNVPLDEGDKSQYCELLVPQLQVRLLLKKADYEIPEMNLRINNEGFRIQQVERYEEPRASRHEYETVQLPKKKIIEHLFATRNNSEYPDAVMMERMRKALREQWDVSGRPRPSEPQRCYVAPISPVSNDLWIYWESKILKITEPGFAGSVWVYSDSLPV